jgi:hypothetical protein
MTMDNGSPWGSNADPRFTSLTVWLIRIGIRVSHSRPYHPQTQGKDERFHRTLNVELLKNNSFRDLEHAQQRFDLWRNVYNLQRPHEALAMEVPATRYRPSSRSFPESLPAILYDSNVQVRKVQQGGEIWFRGRTFKIGNAFSGHPVALRPTPFEDVFDVVFCNQNITQIQLKQPDLTQ